MAPKLSIVIPAYNEAARLGRTIHTVLEYLNKYLPGAELIIVDDGSSDDTAILARRSLADIGITTSVIRINPNRGKGYAVRSGLLAARSDIALFSDADLSTPITEAPKLVGPIQKGECDLTFGSRALDRSL